MVSSLRIPLLSTAVLALFGAPMVATASVSRHECAPNQLSFANEAPALLSGHSAHAATASHTAPAMALPVERGAVLSDGQQCSHCVHPHCATSQHCAAPAAVALSSRGAVFIAPATGIPGGGWLPDRPLSYNLAPPIPPPQALL